MEDSNYVKNSSVNPFFLIIDKVNGYTEKNGNKYLDITKYTELWDDFKYLIKTIRNG